MELEAQNPIKGAILAERNVEVAGKLLINLIESIIDTKKP